MISLLMVGSIILGLIAWILPGINIGRKKKNYNTNWAIYSIISISACAIAISFQIIYMNRMMQIGDLSGLMDTSGTSTMLSLILLIGTLALNGISLNIYHDKK